MLYLEIWIFYLVNVKLIRTTVQEVISNWNLQINNKLSTIKNNVLQRKTVTDKNHFIIKRVPTKLRIGDTTLTYVYLLTNSYCRIHFYIMLFSLSAEGWNLLKKISRWYLWVSSLVFLFSFFLWVNVGGPA